MSEDNSTDAGASDTLSALPARATTADLACEVARLVERISRLKAALRMVLDDLTCRVKTQEPVPGALRDFESVRREINEALED